MVARRSRVGYKRRREKEREREKWINRERDGAL
jgi:hypothetical protein